MSDERAWNYCSICGRKIPVGEMCYVVKRNAALFFSGNTICKDCIAPENYEPAPAADVRPVVRGRWIEKPYLLGTTNVCSVCGENYGMPHGKYNFCPNCGADMRGGSEQ